WVGALSEEMYLAHVQQHSAAVFGQVADLPVPRTHFGVGAAHLLPPMWEAGATAMGIDHRLRLDHALEILPEGTPVQGNIDPAVLFTSEQARFAEADAVLAAGAGASGHVVNLGHGVPPDADPQVLTDLVSYLHSQPEAPGAAGRAWGRAPWSSAAGSRACWRPDGGSGRGPGAGARAGGRRRRGDRRGPGRGPGAEHRRRGLLDGVRRGRRPARG